MYLILAVIYFIIWLFILGFDSLGLAIGNDPYGNKVAIKTTVSENIFAILVLLIPTSLFFIAFALIKSTPNLLKKAKLVSTLLIFSLPLFVLLISIVQEIRGGDKDLRGFAFILTTIWTVLVFAPLWLLNLFGGRDISKVIEDSQKINQ